VEDGMTLTLEGRHFIVMYDGVTLFDDFSYGAK
jgi:hypothetical protein